MDDRPVGILADLGGIANRKELLMPDTKHQDRLLATQIANALFTNGFGQEATRLVLEMVGGRSGGGWCKQAVIEVIEKMLVQETVRRGKEHSK